MGRSLISTTAMLRLLTRRGTWFWCVPCSPSSSTLWSARARRSGTWFRSVCRSALCTLARDPSPSVCTQQTHYTDHKQVKYLTTFITLPAVWQRSVVRSVSVCVCVCVPVCPRAYLRNYAPIFTSLCKLRTDVVRSFFRGVAMRYSSGFMDDVMFARNGPGNRRREKSEYWKRFNGEQHWSDLAAAPDRRPSLMCTTALIWLTTTNIRDSEPTWPTQWNFQHGSNPQYTNRIYRYKKPQIPSRQNCCHSLVISNTEYWTRYTLCWLCNK